MTYMYQHKNIGQGIITIFDSYGKGYTLLPNGEVTIDKRSEGNGVIVINSYAQQVTVNIEEIKQQKKIRRVIKK